MGRIRSRRRGTNVIEFALTAPVFLLLLGMTIQLAISFFYRAAADEAARVACNAGSGVAEDVGDPVGVAVARMQERAVAWGGSCDLFDCSAALEGASPQRFLRCTVSGRSDRLFGVGLPLDFDIRHERRLSYQ